MGTLTITYPDAKAVDIYTTLAAVYGLDLTGLGNAEAKALVDDYIRDRITTEYQGQKLQAEINSFVPPDPELT